jgi:hypothetical protein
LQRKSTKIVQTSGAGLGWIKELMMKRSCDKVKESQFPTVYTATLQCLLVRRQVGVRSHMISFGQSLVGRTRESYNDYDFSHVMKPEKSGNHLSVACWGESYNSESYKGGTTVVRN